MIVVGVEVPGHPYDVIVGDGARHHLASVLPVGARRAAVVTQAGIGVDVDPGCDHQVFTIGDGEQAKSMATVEQLCRQWTRWGLTRADVVVAVGGGLVTDVAGFAAAVYHRGVAVVHVATSLLAQIDAAIGGKTGVNLPEGKNLVGAFWQPAAVLCDTGVLATLPEREVRNGFGELAKYRFLGLDDNHAATSIDDPALAQTVAACVAIKAAVVADDEREAGRRALLNYGHTLGHALEVAGRFDLRHGEAVAIGIVYASRLACALGRIGPERVGQHERIIAGYGLPTTLPDGVDIAELVAIMGRDKKAVDGLTFVLDGPDGPAVVPGIDPLVVADQLEEMP
jgi:5-deoxy-5-amino-3-dehydroquinate synthase